MSKFSLLLALLITLPAAAVTPEQMADDCLKIKNYAAAGDKFYQQHNYPKARAQYESQAAWSESCQLDGNKLATAYNNIALTYIHEKNYLKARVWLELIPEDKKSIYNLARIKEQLALASASVSASPEGEYWSYAGKTLWNVITVKRSDKKYTIDFEGYYAGLMAMYGGPNMGEFSTLVTIENGHARYSMTDQNEQDFNCIYDFSFAKDSLTLEKVSGDNCGFGHNVSAEGSYTKVAGR